MGWIFIHKSRDELVQKLIEAFDTGHYTHKTLTHTLCGNLLWSVIEITVRQVSPFKDLAPGQSRQYIVCDLLDHCSGRWGYKRLQEAAHPAYYSCPLSYLDMAPEQNPSWREKVRAYHANRKPLAQPEALSA